MLSLIYCILEVVKDDQRMKQVSSSIEYQGCVVYRECDVMLYYVVCVLIRTFDVWSVICISVFAGDGYILDIQPRCSGCLSM